MNTDIRRKPFSVTEMIKEMTDGAESPATAYDISGAGTRSIGTPRRDDFGSDSGSPTPGPANPPAAVPAARAVEDILIERKKTHGDFTDHARITQSIKRIMRSEVGWDRLSDCQRESLEMNAHKIGRILAGNPDVNDHWDDIAGYAKLVSERING